MIALVDLATDCPGSLVARANVDGFINKLEASRREKSYFCQSPHHLQHLFAGTHLFNFSMMGGYGFLPPSLSVAIVSCQGWGSEYSPQVRQTADNLEKN